MTEGSTSPVAKRKRESPEPDAESDRANPKRLSSHEQNGEHDLGALEVPPEAGPSEHTHKPPARPSLNPTDEQHYNAMASAAVALGMYPSMTIPQPTDVSFASQPQDQNHGPEGLESAPPPSLPPTRTYRPLVGSEEWHKIRKDNHKEVERRRRETINEGINELAKIVPGCEKNKGSILQRAVQFITQLKDNETQNIEKWTLEKLLTEQAIAELSASNDKLKQECERAWREVETWKKTCQSAGLSVKEDGAKQES